MINQSNLTKTIRHRTKMEKEDHSDQIESHETEFDYEIPEKTEFSARRSFVKQGILVWLTFQNSVHTVLVRYSRARPVKDMFLPSCAVFWTEVLKFWICVGAVVWEQRSLLIGVLELWRAVVMHPVDTLKVCVPSFLYTLQNNLMYVAASHLEAATFMVTAQLKILTTAVFSVLMLKKSLSKLQWLALTLLFVGVSIVQLQQQQAVSAKNKNHTNARAENPLFGLLCIVAACISSGFCGVYFEKILKDSSEISIWVRNAQLAVCAIPLSFFTILAADWTKIRESGLMFGFDHVVWITCAWYGIGGLSVSVCIKYADNILKNFATSVAIILSTAASMYIFDFQLTWTFSLGAAIVIGSIFLYSNDWLKLLLKAKVSISTEEPKIDQTNHVLPKG